MGTANLPDKRTGTVCGTQARPLHLGQNASGLSSTLS
jgi:hypothetical protein